MRSDRASAGPDRNRTLTLSHLLITHWRALLLGLIAVGAETAAGLLDPWPLKIVLDSVLRARALPTWLAHTIALTLGTGATAVLAFAVLAVLAVALIGAVGSYVEKRTITTIGQRVTHDLRRTFFWQMQRLSMSYHDNRRTGDVIGLLTTDIDAVQSAVTSGVLDALYSALTLIGMIAIMLYLDWRFTLVALSVLPVLLVVVYTYTRRIKRASRDVRQQESELVSIVQDVLTGLRIVKAFAREEYEQRRFDDRSRDVVDVTLRARDLKARLAPEVDILVASGTALVLWFGARQAIAGALTPGLLVVFLLYLGKMYKPIRELSKMTDTYSRAIVGWDRLVDFLALALEVRDAPGAPPAPRFRGAVELEHVTFGYAPDRPALHDLSLRIEPGQIAALVGPTGSGKTTVANLIPRLYDPQSGRVLIDDLDVRTLQRRTIREQISVVLQDTLLFRGSIRDNIAFAKPPATRAEIMRAARLANADEFIDRLPGGYDTMIGERGVTLSAGQRQRIAIARAVLRDAPILILDEPSTALDAASEALVLSAIERLVRGKTTIVIAHRLSTIQNADVIFVLENGRVTAHGTHAELLAGGGLYARYYELQSHLESEAELEHVSGSSMQWTRDA
jgi:ATP-binding cassette, subfamily B, bacterial